MKGRIPQPIALHVANGTYRKDRHGNTLEAQAAIPKTPSGMNKDARNFWRYYARGWPSYGYSANWTAKHSQSIAAPRLGERRQKAK